MKWISLELATATKLLMTLHSRLETTIKLLDHDHYLESGKTFGKGELNSPVSDDFNKTCFLK